MYYSLLNFSEENFIEKHKSGENPKIQNILNINLTKFG